MKDYKTVTDRFERYLSNGEIRGATVMIYENGEAVYCHSFGFADAAKTKPVDEHTVYWLASMTKPVMAAAFMKLVEQGEASLEDPVTKFLPQFGRDGKENVKIIHLMNHSSGLGMVGFPGMLTAMQLSDRQDDLATRVDRWAKELPLDFVPGTNTLYSAAAGFDILGRIAEVISSESLAQFLQETILNPLKMQNTTFLPDASEATVIAEPFLNPHIDTQMPPMPEGLITLPDSTDARIAGYYSGAAGLFGTAQDYLQIAKMFVNGGEADGVRILKPETIRLMRAPSNNLHPVPGVTWGLGMQVFADPSITGRSRAESSFGWSGAIGTHFYVEPMEHRAVILTTRIDNCGGSESYVSRGLEEAVFSSEQ